MKPADRLQAFSRSLQERSSLAFLPFSADLTYLTGLPRPFPNYGRLIHPGDWVEGLWILPGQEPLMILTRMTAEFGAVAADNVRADNVRADNVRVTILGDQQDPAALLRDLLGQARLREGLDLAVSETTRAETLVHLLGLLPGAKLTSATELLRPMRRVKDADEITAMQEAGRICEAAFTDLLGQLKPAMSALEVISELEVIGELDLRLRQRGAFGPSFSTAIYCAGPGHELDFDEQRTWPRRLEPPVSVLFDFGAIYQGYCYDYGRTVAFGEPDPAFVRTHALVMRAQQAGIRALKAGTTAAEVDAAARQVIAEAGFGAEFRHRLGHGIGLDVHEPPFLTASDGSVLEEGMLFTIEPSILFERRCSARVEDVVQVGRQGGLPLTAGFQELVVID
jgi:Xaa-Pro aminopeptidase